MFYAPIKNTARIDTAEMDYFRFGEGEKIFVMIPGISIKKVSETASSVAGAYRDFCKEYTVYVFDRKNNIEPGYSIEAMAEDTAKVMKSLGLKDVYLFGVSQGGMIAQCLAAEHPELVKKLLLASTVAKETKESREILTYWTCCALKGKRKELIEGFLDALYTEKLLKKYKEYLVEMFKETTDGELIRFCFLAASCEGLDLTEKLKKIKCPAFVMGGAKDKLFGVESFKALADSLNCGMYIFEDYCHAVYDESPEFKKKIAEFFAQ